MIEDIDASDFEFLEGKFVKKNQEYINFKNEISKKAKKYKNKPVEDWPPIVINWDLNPSNQRFCLDGCTQKEFDSVYTEGFILGWTKLNDFDKHLCHYSRRDDGELWKVGDKSKLAEMLVYLSEGHPISPPLAKYNDESHLIIFWGGHHRYAVAKAINENMILICILPEEKSKINRLINVNWNS